MGCFLSYFCSPDCQEKGWRKHKTVWKETRAQYKKVTLDHSGARAEKSSVTVCADLGGPRCNL